MKNSQQKTEAFHSIPSRRQREFVELKVRQHSLLSEELSIHVHRVAARWPCELLIFVAHASPLRLVIGEQRLVQNLDVFFVPNQFKVHVPDALLQLDLINSIPSLETLQEEVELLWSVSNLLL